jgi:hypothetical protein
LAKELGMVAHAYNPSYLGGREDNPGTKLVKPHLNQWLNVVVHACHPSYAEKDPAMQGRTNRRILDQASQGIRQDHILKITNIKWTEM